MDQSAPTAATPLVLVVDDDEAVRSALKFALELEGFRVETFESGEALLMRQLPGKDVCVVLDERLPGISGLETLRQLRRRRTAPATILITSQPNLQLRVSAAAAGVPIVEKPILGDGLVGAIRAALAS